MSATAPAPTAAPPDQSSVLDSKSADMMGGVADAADKVAERKSNEVFLDDLGRDVEIRKCRVRYIGLILGTAKRFLGGLSQGDFEAIVGGRKSLDLVSLMETLEGSSTDLRDIAVALSSLEQEEVEDITLSDYLKLLEKAWEVNEDFFSKELPRRMKRLGMLDLKRKPAPVQPVEASSAQNTGKTSS